jgi:hypothetical protein
MNKFWEGFAKEALAEKQPEPYDGFCGTLKNTTRKSPQTSAARCSPVRLGGPSVTMSARIVPTIIERVFGDQARV